MAMQRLSNQASGRRQGDVERETTGTRYHAELAMKAARKMRSTRQKRKTGHIVCHHLKMMLDSDDRPMTRCPGKANQYRLSF